MYIPTKNATVAPAMNTPLSAGQIYCSKKIQQPLASGLSTAKFKAPRTEASAVLSRLAVSGLWPSTDDIYVGKGIFWFTPGTMCGL